MWRDKWWVAHVRPRPAPALGPRRVALLGDAAHRPLQYMAQGAIMAIEDGWVLAEHVAARQAVRTESGPGSGSGVDWDAALAAYDAVRPPHCARVQTTARAWGELWHLDGLARRQRNVVLHGRDTYDYTYTDWIYGTTALTPDQEPPSYPRFPLSSVEVVGPEAPAQLASTNLAASATPTRVSIVSSSVPSSVITESTTRRPPASRIQ